MCNFSLYTKYYYQIVNLNWEDAFRMVDLDFDGNISKQDLKEFLIKVLKIENQITEPQLDRLFKLLDHYKRDCVQADDFKRIFDDGMLKYFDVNVDGRSISGQDKSVSFTSGRTSPSAFSWKLNARQQIGLMISKTFSSLQEAFDEISGYTTRIIWKKFINWVDSVQALQGFNLTEHLLLQFFSDLDPHKKGYLTYSDFEQAFGRSLSFLKYKKILIGAYNWNKQLISEIQDVIHTNFNDIKAAYKYFLKRGTANNSDVAILKPKIISYSSFLEAINFLLPKRFSNSEITHVWKSLTNDETGMDYHRFCEVISPNKFKGTLTLPESSSLR